MTTDYAGETRLPVVLAARLRENFERYRDADRGQMA
jgi:hypothetical protein